MQRYEDSASILQGVGDVILKLVCDGATPKQWAEWLRTPLEHAARTADYELAAKLLKAGANASAGRQGSDGRTLLHAAAEGGSEQVVTALIGASKGGDLNTITQHTRQTPLHFAARGGKEAAGRVLIMAGADVNVRDATQNLPLHLAIKDSHVRLTEDLLLAGSNPNDRDSTGTCPIHIAAHRGENELVMALIQKRVDLNCLDPDGRTPLSLAVDGVHISSAKLLLTGGANPNFRMAAGSTVLHSAAEDGRGAAILALVEAGADLEARNTYGETPLRRAVHRAQNSSLRALLQLGANVHTTCRRGCTPLHIACMHGNADAADLLLREGADEKVVGRVDRMVISMAPAVASASAEDRHRFERLSRLLDNASQDRAWRRRGFLIMCRAHSDRAHLLVDMPDILPGAIDHLWERRRPGARSRQGVGSGTELSGVRGGAEGREAGRGTGDGNRARRRGCDGGFDDVAAWLMRLPDEDVFRNILGFL